MISTLHQSFCKLFVPSHDMFVFRLGIGPPSVRISEEYKFMTGASKYVIVFGVCIPSHDIFRSPTKDGQLASVPKACGFVIQVTLLGISMRKGKARKNDLARKGTTRTLKL